MRDLLLGVATLMIGVTSIALGAWAYAARDEESFLRQNWSGVLWLNAPVTTAMVPWGVGCTLFGAAFIVGKNPITTVMLIVGMAAIFAGWILFFIHPRWVQPRGMRRPKG